MFARDIKPYIEGLITYNKIDDSTGKSIDRDFGDTYPYYAKNDNGIGYGVEIGLSELLPKVRLAAQFLQTNFDIKGELSPGTTYLNGVSSSNGKNSVKLYMLNAYYDFDLSEKIIPFVAVGIGAAATAIYNNNNMDNLDVVAMNIYMNADAVTLNTQTYTAENVWIGDNGTNGLIRTMLSVDPSVIVRGNINDASPQNIHSLRMLALSQSPSIIPYIKYGDVGDINPLKDFKAVLSVQKDVFNSTNLLGDYDPTVSLGNPTDPGNIYQPKPSNVNTNFNRFADAGTLLNNISQYMKGREMQQFSEGGTSEGTVEVSVICNQNADGSSENKDCK